MCLSVKGRSNTVEELELWSKLKELISQSIKHVILSILVLNERSSCSPVFNTVPGCGTKIDIVVTGKEN